jgi:hypothetical protein
LEDWVGPGKYPTLHSSKDGDIVRGVLELLHHRVTLGFPTFFVKVRAHRGEPYNEAADRIASTATMDEDVPLLWNAPSGRIIYQLTLLLKPRRPFEPVKGGSGRNLPISS